MNKAADKLEALTDEQWLTVNPENRKMVEEFLRENVQLSKYTLEQYTSALKMYFYWIAENCGNKRFDEIKPRDFLMYQNYLSRRGVSPAGIRFKRSATSSFNNYIDVFYREEYPTFRNYINKAIPLPPPNKVYEKQPLTLSEYKHLCDELEKREMWQQLAYLKFSFSSGARRKEVAQLKKEVINYEPKIRMVDVKDEFGNKVKKESKSYFTNDIRCKGRGIVGKVRKLQFDDDAMQAIKKWIEIRGKDDCEYVFVVKQNGETKNIADGSFDAWCKKHFEPIVGRRVHPHLFRSSRASSLVVEEGKDIESVKSLLGHNSTDTTKIYVIREDEDNADDLFV